MKYRATYPGTLSQLVSIAGKEIKGTILHAFTDTILCATDLPPSSGSLPCSANTSRSYFVHSTQYALQQPQIVKQEAGVAETRNLMLLSKLTSHSLQLRSTQASSSNCSLRCRTHA